MSFKFMNCWICCRSVKIALLNIMYTKLLKVLAMIIHIIVSIVNLDQILTFGICNEIDMAMDVRGTSHIH